MEQVDQLLTDAIDTGWTPDDVLKLALILGVVTSMLLIAASMSYRAAMRRDLEIDSKQMREIWIAIIGLVGTIVGFLLGSSTGP